MTTNSRPLLRILLCSCLATLFASACDSHDSHVQTLGFLADYTELSAGQEGQASLIYIDEAADFSTYTAIMVDPVVAWAWPGADPAETDEDRARELDTALRRELAREFELVEQPRAGALRLRTALASKQDAHPILEVEVLDAARGTRLVAAVDDGSLQEKGETTRAADAIERWAALIPDRLATFRQFDAAARAREARETP